MNSLAKYSVIPKNYKAKDPRPLIYLYPKEVNLVVYAKKVQEFSFFQALEVAETLAHRQGFLLLPFNCMHWQRAKDFGPDRKIKIGRKSFFLMKENELTKTEKRKLSIYLEELNNDYKFKSN